MSDRSILHRPRWRQIAGYLAAAGATAVGAALLASSLIERMTGAGGNARTNGRAVVLTGFLVLMVLVLLGRAIGACRVAHCRSCRRVLFDEPACPCQGAM